MFFWSLLEFGKLELLTINSFPPSGNFYHLLITFADRFDPDPGLIWIKTVWHSDGMPKLSFQNH